MPEESEPTADYPLGGSVEPYDIARELEMIDGVEVPIKQIEEIKGINAYDISRGITTDTASDFVREYIERPVMEVAPDELSSIPLGRKPIYMRINFKEDIAVKSGHSTFETMYAEKNKTNEWQHRMFRLIQEGGKRLTVIKTRHIGKSLARKSEKDYWDWVGKFIDKT